MRRYLLPGLVMLLALPLPYFPILSDGVPQMYAALLIYSAGALWWVIRACTAPHSRRLRLLAVWVPAVLPLWLSAAALWGLRYEEHAILGVMLFVPVAAWTLLLACAGMFVVLTRRAA